MNPNQTPYPRKNTRKKKQNGLLIILIILIFLILFAAVIAYFLLEEKKSDERIRQQLSLGERYYEELDYDRAIAAYSEVLDIDPKNEEALYGIAQSYEARGEERRQNGEDYSEDYAAARDYYEQAVTYYPNSDRAEEAREEIARIETLISEEEVPQVMLASPEEHLILFTDSCDLLYGEETTLFVTVRIPSSWEAGELSLYLDDELLYAIPAEELISAGEVLLGDIAYQDHLIQITVPDQGDEDPSFTKVLRAVKGDYESNEVVLYRNMDLSDEAVVTAGHILDEINLLAWSIASSEGEESDTNPSLDDISEKILEEVYNYLETSADVKTVHRTGNRIDFITTDGFSSFFEIGDSDSELASSGSGSGNASTTDIRALENAFTHDPGFRETVIDPDVMVLCPVHSTDELRTGNPHMTAGKTLADHLNGTAVFYKDKDCLGFDIFRDMGQFGTIMLCTHGGTDSRGDGSTVVNWRFYNQKVSFNTAADDISKLTNSEEIIWDITQQKPPSSWGADENVTGIKLYMFKADENAQEASFGVRWIKKDVHESLIKWEVYYEFDLYTDAIMHFCPDVQLPNSIVYLGTCNSLADDRFNTFLLDHGASSIIGYQGEIYCPTEDTLCTLLFEEAIKENVDTKTEESACSYSVLEAANNVFAKNRWDPSDSLFSFVKDITDHNLVSRFMSVKGYEFHYEGHGIVEGTVTDIGGKPLEGAVVSAYRYFLKNGAPHHLQFEMQTTTDAEGHYQFKNLHWGEYLIHAEYESATAGRHTNFAEPSKKEQDLQLMIGKISTDHPTIASASEDWIYAVSQYPEPAFSKVVRYSKDRTISEDLPLFNTGTGEQPQDLQFYDGKLYVSGGEGVYVYDELSGSVSTFSLNLCPPGKSGLQLGSAPGFGHWQITNGKLYYVYLDQLDNYFLKCTDLEGNETGFSLPLHNNPAHSYNEPEFYIQGDNVYYTEFLPEGEYGWENGSYKIWKAALDGSYEEVIYTSAKQYTIRLLDQNNQYLAISEVKTRDGVSNKLLLIPLQDANAGMVAITEKGYDHISAGFHENTLVYCAINDGLYRYDIASGQTEKLSSQTDRFITVVDDFCYCSFAGPDLGWDRVLCPLSDQ